MTAPVDTAPVDVTSIRSRGRALLRWQERAFAGAVAACVVFGLLSLVVLVGDAFLDGRSRLNLDLIRKFPASDALDAGAQSALFGTLWVVGIAALLALPIGICAAVYLEEFADRTRWWNRLTELNVQNLAAVPAIVYGILGLAFIARGPLSFGFVVITAAMTLALLILPIVIITTREALRAVPPSIRHASLSLGASSWQTVWRQVMPAAVPGIATGSILAVSRAMGEAAPVIMLGGLSFVTFNPDGPTSPFTVLPIQIFNWVSRPQAEFATLAAATIILLLMVLLTMNSVAIYVRNRYGRSRW